MKKKLSLFLVAFLAAMAYAATTTWKVTGDEGQTSINAETTLINADALTVKTVYATTLKNDAPTIEGESFTKAITIRTDGYPTADNLTGKEKQGSTSLIVTVKQDCDVTLYYRHQSSNTQKEKQVDPDTGDEIDVITSVTHVENDSKDLIVFDQADISTKMSGKVNFYGNELDEYKYATKKVSLKKDHVYTITASGTTLQFYGLTYETEDAQPVAETDYYLVGSMNDWTEADAYKFEANPDADGEYMLTTTFEAGAEFKVKSGNTWYPDGENNNYVINEDGEYTVYFRPDGQGGQDWHYGCIYAAKKEVTPEPQPTETTWQKATSIAIGDIVILTAEGSTKSGPYAKELNELTGKIGNVTDYTDLPAGIIELTVEAGIQDETFAFKTADNKYLAANTSNELPLQDAVDNASSWTVTFTDGVPTITNVAQGTRSLKYNSGSPRFACYTSAQNPVTLWKKVSGDEPVVTNTYGIVGDLTGGWETDAEMKKVIGADGVYILFVDDFEAKAGTEYQYKLRANKSWDGYQLPDGQKNFTWTPEADGIYTLIFTANINENTLDLVATKTSINTVAELNKLENNTAFKFYGNAIVVAKMAKGNANYVYITDETGSSLIYDADGKSTANIAVGNVLTAPWAGTVSIYKNLFEVKPTEALGATSTVEVKYPEVTADYVKAENMNQVVLIKGLSIEDVDTKGNIKFTIGDDVVPGYNQFGIKLEFEGNTFDVVGAISVYNENVQFQPITITEVQEPQPAEIDKVQLLGTWNWTPEEGYLTLTKGEGFDWTGTLDLSKVTLDQNFKLVINGKDWIGTHQLTLVDQNDLVTVAEKDGADFILNNANSGFQTYTITAKWQANANAAEGWTLEIAGKDERVTNTYTATFSNTGNWENVYAYAYAKIGEGDATQTREFLGGWPGKQLTKNAETGLYEVEIKDSYAPQIIIFNNGIEGDGAIQTENLAFENGKTYSYEKPEPQPAGDTWTVAGNSGSLFGTAWDPENTANDMTLTEGLYTWEKNEVTLTTEEPIQFKVVKNHSWDEAYPEQNYELNIPADGVYGIKITFNAETKEVKAETTGGPELNTFTATFSNTGNWADVYAYTWTEDEAGQVIAKELGAWPGTKLKAGTDGIFNVLIQALNAPQFIIFNNGIEGEGAIQTKNLAFENGKTYEYEVEPTPEEQEFTVQFVNNRGWQQGNVRAYAWNANGDVLGAWPGTEMGLIDTEVTYGGEKYEVYELKFKAAAAPEFIIFNNGQGGNDNQTEDLVFVNEKQYLVLPMKGELACSVKEPMQLDYSDNVKMYNGMPMIIWGQPMLDSKVTFKVGDALHIRIVECPGMRSPGLQLMSDDGKTPITENLAAGLKEVPAIITIPITGAVYEWMKDADRRVRLNGQNVFIDRMTVEPDVYPAAETPAEEETTVSVWVPENAEGEQIAQEEKVEIPATPFVVVDVKKEEIVKIKASDAVAPSRGLGGAVTALAASDISILKKGSTDLLVADDQIRVSEGDSGYEFTVSDEATVTELKTNGFDIKNKTEKPLVIKAIEVQQVVVPEDIVISPESGDIAAALATASEGKTVGDITINLTAGGAYTIGSSIVAPASVTINGADGAVIDASALEGNFIQMAATYDQTDQTATPTEWTVADIAVKNVTIKGLKKALFYSTQKMYVANDFTIDNCIVEQAADATTIDYTKGSTAKNITVTNSTFYAPTATTKSFYSSQSGQKYTEYNGDAVQTFKFENNTMYNLALGKNFFSHRQANQTWIAYTVKNNIFVNCGKSGQVIKGMNGGQSGKNPTWDIDGNIFNFDGADSSAAEDTGDADEPVKNSVKGIISFVDASNGNFDAVFLPAEGQDQPATIPGDPRWTITPAKQLYVIGDASVNGWGSDTPAAPTAMTLKDGSFEVEFTSTAANAYFAIVDKADATTWDELSGHRYGIGDGDQTITLDTPTDLVKYDNGTIVIAGAGKYKVSVSADMKVTVTKTGEIEHTYTVAGSFYYADGNVDIFGTNWDATNVANDMEKQTDGTYKKVYENVNFDYAGKIEFKVVQDHAWDVNYGWTPTAENPNGNASYYVDAAQTGATITITFDPAGATPEDMLKVEFTAGVPTGINGIDNDAAGEQGVYYNLQGVRVANPGKGVYIKNGKKVLVK